MNRKTSVHSFVTLWGNCIVVPAEYKTEERKSNNCCREQQRVILKKQFNRRRVVLTAQYFASTMMIVGMSVVVTVIVLQFHHHDPHGGKMPKWVRKMLYIFVFVTRHNQFINKQKHPNQ